MTESDPDRIVDGYFDRLEELLSGLSQDRRDQLIDELKDHVSQARAGLDVESAAEVHEILERIGSPEEIAAEALDGGTTSGIVGYLLGRRPRLGRRVMMTERRWILLGAISGFIFVLTYLLSMLIAPSSPDANSGGETILLYAAWNYGSLIASGLAGIASAFLFLPFLAMTHRMIARSAGEHRTPASILLASGTVFAAIGAISGAFTTAFATQTLTPDLPALFLVRTVMMNGAFDLAAAVMIGVLGFGLVSSRIVDPWFGPISAVLAGCAAAGGGAMLILSSYSQSWMVIQTIGTSGVAFVVLVASVAAIVSLLPDREAAVDTEGAKTSVSLPYRLGLARPLTLNPRLIGLLAVTLLMIAAVIAVPLTTRGSDAQLASLSVTPTVPGAPGTATPRYLSGGSNISQSPPSSSSGASVGADGSAICGPTTDAETSGGPPTALEGSAKQVASGTIEGKPWSLWSMKGQFGAVGIENGGLVFDGREYGLCPGYPNPSETEMIATNGQAIIYGVVNYPGLAKVQVSTGTIHTFIVGSPLPSPRVQVVNGVSFYIGTLPLPACSYNYLEINTTSPSYSAQHVIGFGGNGAGQGYSISNNPGNSGSCVTSGKLDPLTYSEGQWQLPPGQFNGR